MQSNDDREWQTQSSRHIYVPPKDSQIKKIRKRGVHTKNMDRRISPTTHCDDERLSRERKKKKKKKQEEGKNTKIYSLVKRKKIQHRGSDALRSFPFHFLFPALVLLPSSSFSFSPLTTSSLTILVCCHHTHRNKTSQVELR